MAEPYMSQIILVPFLWAPQLYSKCDGSVLPVDQNTLLFSLLGPLFGGDGEKYFALPDLRGRAVLHEDREPYSRGDIGGAEEVVLQHDQMPCHTHKVLATNEPGNKYIATDSILAMPLKSDGSYSEFYTNPNDKNVVAMSTGTCSYIGNNEAHYNMQPSIVVNFCIATSGTYPPRGE